MFPRDQERLKNCASWQAAFIHDNFLVIGHFAWAGFLHHDWGLLLCDVEPSSLAINRRWQRWHFTAQFIPGADLPDRLPSLGILPSEVTRLVAAISQYHPPQEIMLMLRCRQAEALSTGGSLEVMWLQNLAVTPPVCHQQVIERWDEFMADTHFVPKMGNSNW